MTNWSSRFPSGVFLSTPSISTHFRQRRAHAKSTHTPRAHAHANRTYGWDVLTHMSSLALTRERVRALSARARAQHPGLSNEQIPCAAVTAIVSVITFVVGDSQIST